jgi:DNA-binding transcriptional LysR family regulator
VRAGLAVTTLPASMVGEGLRVLGTEEGLPELPLTRMGLIHAPGRATEEAKALAEAIRMTVGAPARAALKNLSSLETTSTAGVQFTQNNGVTL